MGLPWAPSLWGQWGFHGRFRGADAAQWPLHKPYRQQRTHSPCGAVDPNRSLCQSLMHPGVTAGQTRCTVPHAGLGSGAHASTRCPQPPTWGEMGRESCCDPHPHHPCPHGSPSMCILYSPCSSSCRSVPMDPPSPWVSYPPPPMGPYPCRSPSLCVPIPTRGHVPIIPHSHISPPPGVPYSPRVPGGHCPYSPLTSVLFCPHPHVPLPHLPIPPRMASLGTGGPQQITPPGESTKEAASPNPPLPRTPQDPPSSTVLPQPSAPAFCVHCRP